MRALVAVIAVWCSGGLAAEHKIECPKEIKRDTIQITRAPTGWTPFYLYEYEPGLPLNGAGLMWGPPSSIAMAKPNWSGKVAGKDTVKWTELGGKESGEKWFACYYGDHGQNDAILSKQLDASVTECTVTYPKARGGDLEVTCKW